MNRWLLGLCSLMLAGLAAPALGHAQTVAAGETVVNQASVTYRDDTGAARQATTNEVVLLVQQVFSATLEGDRAGQVLAGGDAVFVHALTNTGNGPDTYCVSATDAGGDDGQFDRIDVLFDVNSNGLADPDEEVLFSSGVGTLGELRLEAGEVAGLLVRGRVPTDGIDDDEFATDLLVTAQGGTGVCAASVVTDIGTNADGADGTNQDIATITTGAVLSISKSAVYEANNLTDRTDDTLTYTVRVENIGVAPADDLVLTDVLPPEVIFDAFGPDTSVFTTGPLHDAGEVTAELVTLLAGDEAVIVIETRIVPTTLEVTTIENVAVVMADLDGDSVPEPEQMSNTVQDQVVAVFDVVLSDTGGSASPGVNDGADDDATINDTQLTDIGVPGDAAIFTLTVTNTGNTMDRYNLILSGGTGWLANAGLQFLRSDGQTPLLDTTGDGLADTGDLAPGESVMVVVTATLSAIEPAAPHGLVITAVSTAEISGGATAASDPAMLAVGAGGISRVDLANTIDAAGFNDGGVADADPASAITTELIAPPSGEARFPLFVANEGVGRDAYALSAAGALNGDPLPVGVSVRFEDPDGAPITSSPALGPQETFAYFAIVSLPELADGSVQPIFFSVNSLETGVSDVKQDAVRILARPAIDISPGQFGQVAACGVREYLHVLSNTGGTLEDVSLSISGLDLLTGELRLPTGLLGGEPADFQIAEFLVPGDPIPVLGGAGYSLGVLVSDGASGVAVPLGPGEETRVLVRVSAPCSAPDGTRESVQLVAQTIDGDAASQLTNVTSVSATQLQIIKMGALDALCDETADAPFADAQVQAGPGECVIWQLEVANIGVETVCQTTARDAAPAFTTLSGVPRILVEPSPGSGACEVTGESFTCTLGNETDITGDAVNETFCLQAGEMALVEFSVRIE